MTKSRAIQLNKPSLSPLSSSSADKNTKILSKNVFESLLSQDKNKINSNNNDEYDDDDNGEYDDDDNSNADDQEDEGTIHRYESQLDKNRLLDTLTNINNKQSEISHFSQSPFPTVTRKYPTDTDGTNVNEAPLPGPPRDLVAQIVNPRFVALSWMEPIKNPDEVISYTVYYKMTTSER